MLRLILPLLSCICLAGQGFAQDAVPYDAYSDKVVSSKIEDLPEAVRVTRQKLSDPQVFVAGD